MSRSSSWSLGDSGHNGPSDTLEAVFAGIVFSQVSLLGIWAGMASNPWYVRLAGAAIGNGYLCVPLGLSGGVVSYMISRPGVFHRDTP